jgi:hypothetical protein
MREASDEDAKRRSIDRKEREGERAAGRAALTRRHARSARSPGDAQRGPEQPQPVGSPRARRAGLRPDDESWPRSLGGQALVDARRAREEPVSWCRVSNVFGERFETLNSPDPRAPATFTRVDVQFPALRP